ncbi:hypothetical protein ONZ45_g7831 [Pleurotus djamor]|nr:hypothetical protein ONZ45_g7831 [Pleurotus djamor]
MASLSMSTPALVVGAAASLLLYILFNDRAPPGIPRVGRAGAIGYIITAIRFTLNSSSVLDEAEKEFQGRPFALPTLSGWMVWLGPEHLETLRTSNDAIFNQPIAVNEVLQLDYTMNPHQQRNPYQAHITRNEITKGIAAFIPEVFEEATLAITETFKVPNGSDDEWTRCAEHISMPVFQTITHVIGRINNRAILGVELCRNKEFIHAVVNFAETLNIYARLLSWSPVYLRRPIYFVLTSLWGGSKEPMEFIKPYLMKRLEERTRAAATSQVFNVAEFLINNAPPEAPTDIDDLAMRVLNLNFGSIHTTSIYITQALFELAQMSADDLEGIRSEIKLALEEEGEWNKDALQRFRKLDSVLREIGRMYGISQFGLNRLTIASGRLYDGTVIPPKYFVAINLRAIHFNPSVYPNPNTFDPFRFSKRREEEGEHAFYL